MKINFKLFDLSVDKIKDPIAYFIDLQEDYFTLWLEAIYDREPQGEDLDSEEYEPAENEYILDVSTYEKSTIRGFAISESFNNEIQVYTISVILEGDLGTLLINFQTKKEMLTIYKQLISYRFSKDAN